MHTPRTQPIDLPHDIKLVVADMDGTLLDETGEIPASFWPLLERLAERDIVFAPASGRQYPALAEMFATASRGLALISENGAFVVRDGQEISSRTVDPAVARHTVARARELSNEFNLGLVWSGRRSAYVERSETAFVEETRRYYTSLEVVDDLLEVSEDALKFAVYDFDGGSAGSRARLTEALHPFRVVMSNEYWMDIMDPAVNKGVAVAALQAALKITPDETMVFGDYLNDLEMFAEATHSFAMTNAHPKLLKAARYIAPPNHEHGVITTLTDLMDSEPQGAAGRDPAVPARREPVHGASGLAVPGM